ncbi:uncharacterized protein LOC111114515 [Crassostrea virginica]
MGEKETDSMVREIESSLDFKTRDKDELQQLFRELKEDMQFHRNFQENTSSVLNIWKNELKNVYRTRGTLEVLDETRTNSVVMIIGNSGSGKTTAMRYASLQLQEEGYEIVRISSPRDILSHRCLDRKQLFIIDDVVGKYRVDTIAFNKWKCLQDCISVVFKHSGAKLLVTQRRQLYKTIRYISSSTFFESKIVDLDSIELVLSGDEKMGMLELYLDNRNLSNSISIDEKVEICTCDIAFPLLCNIFSSSQDFFRQKANFFVSPSVVFKKELDRLEKKNKEVYCVLVLLLIFNDEELESIFDIECNIDRIKDVYELLLRVCGVQENIPRKSLKEHLLSLSGTFVKPSNHFKFIHDRLEETLANHFGSRNPDVMLKSCKPEFIRDRVRIKTLRTDDENVLILKCSSFNVLSERIIKEIRNGKFRDVILSEPMQDREFIKQFISQAKRNHISLEQLENMTCKENFLSSQNDFARETTLAKRFSLIEILQSKKNCPIHWIAAMGSLPLFETVFGRQKTKLRKVYEKYTVVTDLLHLAVLGENIDVIESLIKKGGNLNSYDEYGIPLLCKTAGTNRCDIAELLIDRGADVNQPDKVMGWTPCFVASWFNEVEMLKLLISKGADIDVIDPTGKALLVIAVLKNNEQIVSVLLNAGAEIFDYLLTIDCINFKQENQYNFDFTLGIALANKNHKIVELLSDFEKSRNTISVSVPTLCKNSIVVREKLNLFLNEIKREKSNSALWNDFLAASKAVCSNNSRHLVRLLEKSDYISRYSVYGRLPSIEGNRKEKLAKFNQNYLRFSLLHIAAVCDNVDAAIHLVKYGANPLQRDIRGRTSLHFANSSAMLEVLLSAKSTPEYSSKGSNGILMGILFCLSFKCIPAVLNRSECSRADLNINITDNNGNTPLHSIIIQTSDMNRCLDVVETLVNKGAATYLRCKNGYLPIDHFRAVSLKLKERVEERGERLLGGNTTKRYIKKEKQFFIASIFIFTLLYFLVHVYMRKAKNVCIQTDCVRIKWYVSYTQIGVILIMHWLVCALNYILQTYASKGFEVKQTWCLLYSEQMLVSISGKTSIVFIIVREFCNLLYKSFPTDIFFNVYCIFLCFIFSTIYFPTPCRNIFRKHHSICISAFKICSIFYLFVWIFYLVIVYEHSVNVETNKSSAGDDGDWIDLISTIVSKFMSLYFYVCLLGFRLLRPFLYILLNPVAWHVQDSVYLLRAFLLLFFIADILSVPFTMTWCILQNRWN